MKFTVSSRALLKTIQGIQGVIARRSALPIIDYLLFDIGYNGTKITGTNLETTISTTLPVETQSKGSVCIHAKTLVRALRALPDEHLVFQVDKGSKVSISNDLGSYRIASCESAEFPKDPALEDASAFSLPASELLKAINKTLPFTGSDDLRPILTGLFVENGSDGLRFASTDAHRLFVHSIKECDPGNEFGFVLPGRSMRLMQTILRETSGNIDIRFDGRTAVFAFEKTRISVRILDGEFPNYRAVIPADLPNTLTVDRTAFMSAIRRAEVFSNTVTHQVRIRLSPEKVSLISEDLDNDNGANERFPCTYAGESMDVGLNCFFVMDMLRSFNSEQVAIRIQKPNRAVLVQAILDGAIAEDAMGLVMPMMLND